jgi:amino acid adenylation domain-containing protein
MDATSGNTIAALFSRQASRIPETIAVVTNQESLTYRELDLRSESLAFRLQELGVRPDSLVGIAFNRTSELVVSMLAVLKAGGAYVPLDPKYPKERIASIISDSEMKLLLTTSSVKAALPIECRTLRVLQVDALPPEPERAHSLRSTANDANLAYVIYTSGSTGKPKGVMVEHRNVLNFFEGMDQAIGCSPGVWLAVTSVCFDISVLELQWTLTRGFTVALHSDEGGDAIARDIRMHRVTHLQMTPSLARILLMDQRTAAALGSLKQILLGGEAVPASLVRQIRHVFQGQIFNMYGPTETTIWSTTDLVANPDTSVPIGKPILNTEIYLLDENFHPVAGGRIGEIFIGGDGVARGYWKRPDLTAERFITLPAIAETRVYRTGDLGRFLDDGNLECLGRTDFQVKLRGHRIELGEIEAVLEKLTGMLQAVVLLREDREGDKRLVAYLVASGAVVPAENDVKWSVEASLPEYMVPSHFVFLPEMPLTVNGKIDRKALLRMPPPNQAARVSPEAMTGTAKDIEDLISSVWRDALGVSRLDVHANFFDLGAHSLIVAEVHARLKEQLCREIALIDLFQFTSVSALAAHLSGTAPKPAELRSSGRRRRE